MLVIGLGVLVGFVALAIDLAQLSYYKQQMQAGSDISALAAAAALHDQSPLYFQLQQQDAQQAAAITQACLVRQDAMARENAVYFASQNRLAGKPLQINHNAENQPQGGVRTCWVEDSVRRDVPYAERNDQGQFNSAVIRVAANEQPGGPFSLWFAEQLGFGRFNVVVRSQAAVDQRLVGLRPTRTSNIPLVPLMVVPNVADHFLMEDPHLSDLWWANGPVDQFTVDCETGQYKAGAGDNIPEIILRIPTSQPTGDSGVSLPKRGVAFLGIASAPKLGDVIRVIEEGCPAEDLLDIGGQLELDKEEPWLLPVAIGGKRAELEKVRQSLEEMLGQKRVWPLGLEPLVPVEVPSLHLIGFAAGVLVDCSFDDDGSLLLIVQPCILQTPTALVGECEQRNAWIGKLVLCR